MMVVTIVNIDKLIKLAEKGNVEKQYEVGIRYLKGDGVNRDLGEAMCYIHEAAENGYPPALFIRGLRWILDDPRGVGDEYMEDIIESAKNDYPEAQYVLGMMQVTGRHVGHSKMEGCLWLEKAAVSGHPGAAFQLGKILITDNPSKEMEERARELLEYASHHHITGAQMTLSRTFENTEFCGKYWRFMASLQDDPESMKDWVLLFKHGEYWSERILNARGDTGIFPRDEIAKDILSLTDKTIIKTKFHRHQIEIDRAYWQYKGAIYGDTQCQTCVADLIYTGFLEGTKDEIVFWYRMAALKGDTLAASILGSLDYDNWSPPKSGFIVSKDELYERFECSERYS